MSPVAPVMGPAQGSSKPLAFTDPPMFDPQGDLQEYRRDVARWVGTIQAAAEKGTDRLYKTIFATLARQLYDRGLPREQKSIVDGAQAKTLIDYKQEEQIEAIQKIVKLIAVDPPIAVVTRLISSFTEVTQCRRARNEDLNALVSRFRGLAADHLMHVGLSKSSQVSEVLAITLLDNALLSRETLTNAKLQLVSLAEARQKNSGEPEIPIPANSHKSAMKFFEEFKTIFDSDDNVPQSFENASVFRRKATDLINNCRALIEANSDLFHIFTEPPSDENQAHEMFSSGPRCKLNLDDAVTVIRNSTFTPKKTEKSYMKADIDNMVGQKVQQALAAFQKRNEQPSGSSASKDSERKPGTNPSRRRNTNKRRSEQYFFDCGSKDHLRGSYDCPDPHYETKRLRAVKEKAEKNKDKQGKDFRKGSNPSQPSHL